MNCKTCGPDGCSDRVACPRDSEAVAPTADPDSRLLNLLARIHGDGGHYVQRHGIEKAAEDADKMVAEWRAGDDNIESQFNACQHRGYCMSLKAALRAQEPAAYRNALQAAANAMHYLWLLHNDGDSADGHYSDLAALFTKEFEAARCVAPQPAAAPALTPAQQHADDMASVLQKLSGALDPDDWIGDTRALDLIDGVLSKVQGGAA